MPLNGRSREDALGTLKRFAACKIAIYPDDHHPPHFHIEGRGWRALVDIETLTVRAGDARRADEAMAWAARNREILRATWKDLNERS